MEKFYRLVAQIRLLLDMDCEIIEEMMKMQRRIYALEEENKLLKAGHEGLTRRVGEMTIKFGDLRRSVEGKRNG